MTKVFLQPGLRGLSGGMGDWVYSIRKGKTVLGMKPISNKESTEAQSNHRKKFRKALAYATAALADESKRNFYEALSKKRDMGAFALAVGDYLHIPTIEPLDLSAYKGNVGDQIQIITYDNTGVAVVNVELTKTDGTNIERGQAVEQGVASGIWLYTATVPVALGTDIFIEVEAFDRPGHRAVSSANPIVGTDE